MELDQLLRALRLEHPKEEVFQLCYEMMCYLYRVIPQVYHSKPYEGDGDHDAYYSPYNHLLITEDEFSFWLSKLKDSIYDDESFKKAFQICYAFYKACGYYSYAELKLVKDPTVLAQISG